MKHDLKIVMWDVASLIPAEYNPRILSESAHTHLKASIQRFGMVDPVIVNKNNSRHGVVIGGHMRLLIAKELGYVSVPCIEVDLTLEKERELNIRLNRNTGEWDWDKLANEWESKDLLAWGFESKDFAGFSPPDVKKEEPSSHVETTVSDGNSYQIIIKGSIEVFQELVDYCRTNEFEITALKCNGNEFKIGVES